MLNLTHTQPQASNSSPPKTDVKVSLPDQPTDINLATILTTQLSLPGSSIPASTSSELPLTSADAPLTTVLRTAEMVGLENTTHVHSQVGRGVRGAGGSQSARPHTVPDHPGHQSHGNALPRSGFPVSPRKPHVSLGSFKCTYEPHNPNRHSKCVSRSLHTYEPSHRNHPNRHSEATECSTQPTQTYLRTPPRVRTPPRARAGSFVSHSLQTYNHPHYLDTLGFGAIQAEAALRVCSHRQEGN